MRRLILVSALAGCILLPTLAIADGKKEPRYKNRPLHYWVKLLRSEDEKQVKEAGEAIEAIGPAARAAVPVLMELLEDHCPDYQIFAAELLGKIGPDAKAAVPALIGLVESKEYNVRVNAIWTLKSIGPGARAAVPTLLKFLHRSGVEVGDVAITLARIGPGEKIVPELVQAIRTENSHKLALIEALAKIGPEAVPALVEFLGKNDATVREVAADQLAGMGPSAKTAVPALLPLLKDKDPKVRLAAAQALWEIEKHKAIARPLAEIVVRPMGFWETVKDAARTLKAMGPAAREALPLLLEFLRNRPGYTVIEEWNDLVVDVVKKIDPEALKKETAEPPLHGAPPDLPPPPDFPQPRGK
jgi:HEAT repeats